MATRRKVQPTDMTSPDSPTHYPDRLEITDIETTQTGVVAITVATRNEAGGVVASKRYLLKEPQPHPISLIDLIQRAVVEIEATD
jgi:hypothetical protein